MYLGKPASAPSSMKSKSRTRFRAAIATIPAETAIPNGPLECKNPIPDPKKLIMKLTRYSKAIPAVAENTINLKFSVGLMIPLL